MKTGKTSSGFEYEIDEETLNDYEFLEAVKSSDETPFGIVDVVNTLLGKEQVKRLKEHCRENGHVSIERMALETVEIMNGNNETKKS